MDTNISDIFVEKDLGDMLKNIVKESPEDRVTADKEVNGNTI